MRYLVLYFCIIFGFAVGFPALSEITFVYSADLLTGGSVAVFVLSILSTVVCSVYYQGDQNRFYLLIGSGFLFYGMSVALGEILFGQEGNISTYINMLFANTFLPIFIIAALLLEKKIKVSEISTKDIFIFLLVGLVLSVLVILFQQYLVSKPVEKFITINRFFFIPAGLYFLAFLLLFKRFIRFLDNFSGLLLSSMLFGIGSQSYLAVSESSAAFASAFWIGMVIPLMPIIGIIIRAEREMSVKADQMMFRKSIEAALKDSQKKLAQSNQILKNVLDTIPVRVFWKDKNLKYLGCNWLFAKDAGLEKPEDIVGKSDYEMHWKEFADAYRQDDTKIMANKEVRLNLEEPINVFGTDREWIRSSKIPMINSRGEAYGILGIYEDITSRKKDEETLAKYARALESSNSELDEFAYIASHDLKEPLRGISNYSTFLMEDYQDKLDEDGVKKLETLKMLSNRMDNLISSLLQYSRLGRQSLAFKETDLNQVVNEVLESLKVSFEEKNIEIKLPGKFPVINCDHVRVGEVFRNLVSNATKYNDKENRWIEIGVINTADKDKEDQPTHVFYVKDNGIGIREKHLESVFKIFKRLHGRDKFGGGTGSGLTIARKIVERHGGKIWVESVYGEGTVFKFTLEKQKGKAEDDRN